MEGASSQGPSSFLEDKDHLDVVVSPAMPSPIKEVIEQMEALAKQLREENGITVTVLPTGEAVIHEDRGQMPILWGDDALEYLDAAEYADCILIVQPSQRRIFACAGKI